MKKPYLNIHDRHVLKDFPNTVSGWLIRMEYKLIKKMML